MCEFLPKRLLVRGYGHVSLDYASHSQKAVRFLLKRVLAHVEATDPHRSLIGTPPITGRANLNNQPSLSDRCTSSTAIVRQLKLTPGVSIHLATMDCPLHPCFPSPTLYIFFLLCSLFPKLYACHAAAIVHHHMGWTHHEVGKVDIGRMESTLQAAKDCGFSIPFSRSPPPCTITVGLPRPDDDGGDGLWGGRTGNVCHRVSESDTMGSGEAERPREGAMPLPTGDLMVAGGQQQRRQAEGACLPRPSGVSAGTMESLQHGVHGGRPTDEGRSGAGNGEAVSEVGEHEGRQEDFGCRVFSKATVLASSSTSSTSSHPEKQHVDTGPSPAASATCKTTLPVGGGKGPRHGGSINANAPDGATEASPAAVREGTKRRRNESRSCRETLRPKNDCEWRSPSHDVARDTRKDDQESSFEGGVGVSIGIDPDVVKHVRTSSHKKLVSASLTVRSTDKGGPRLQGRTQSLPVWERRSTTWADALVLVFHRVYSMIFRLPPGLESVC